MPKLIQKDDEEAPRVAIDFETSGYYGASACALGAVRIEGGKIVDKFYTLIKPPSSRIYFTHIHGLTWSDLKYAPPFSAIWQQFKKFMEGCVYLLAHNAAFDRNVLFSCCAKYNLSVPGQEFLCTLKGARRCLSIPSKSLGSVCKYLNIELQHHHAGSDALACAMIYNHLRKQGILDHEMFLINNKRNRGPLEI